jgi:hypothetical protein
MNYELFGVLGAVGGLVALAFLYARAASKASLVDQYATINDHLRAVVAAQTTVAADKEEYIRELQKVVLGSLPAGKLVERLNRLFATQSSRASGSLPPGSGAPKAS